MDVFDSRITRPAERDGAWSNPARVLLVGPPGAGKTSQGARLALQIGARHLSTGNLLRDEVRRRSPVGMRANDYMLAGKLAPDWLVLYVLEHHLGRAFEVGVVLDGYPRTLEQARRFTRSLGTRSLDLVIELSVSDEVAIARLRARSVCVDCGEVSNDRSTARCVRCGNEELMCRKDDDADVVRDRIHAHRGRTTPMLDFFARMGVVISIDGARPQDEISAEIFARVAGSANRRDPAFETGLS
jgi:adenylate kinase